MVQSLILSLSLRILTLLPVFFAQRERLEGLLPLIVLLARRERVRHNRQHVRRSRIFDSQRRLQISGRRLSTILVVHDIALFLFLILVDCVG